jgi:hypothetical protein
MREGVWGAIAACTAGSQGASAGETFAVELVRAGVKCMATVDGSSMDRKANFGPDGQRVHHDDVIRLSSISVGNVLFHSQSAAAAADHGHVNATVQNWLRLLQPQPSLPQSSHSSSFPPSSNFLLFALQNLAAHSHTAVLISSLIHPAHLLPLLSPSTRSIHAVAASSFAAGGKEIVNCAFFASDFLVQVY